MLSNLFAPIRIGPFLIKNRIAVAPHGPRYARDGLLTRQYVDYEVEKAKGGAGLIIMSYGLADPQCFPGTLLATWRSENVPLFREICERVHEHDCRIVFQFGQGVHHTGKGASPAPFTGLSGAACTEMSLRQIQAMMDNYARCAERLAEGGLDGVELHGHGDLFSDFLSPVMNRRSDGYGGSFEARMRYILEAMEVIRGVVGTERIMGVRLSVDDGIPGSIALDDGVAVARRLAATGQPDYLNIDTGIEPQRVPQIIAPMYAEQGYQLAACAAVKQAVADVPVFAVGRIVDVAHADSVIAAGMADMVTMARALIADPELPNKAKEGRLADIRPCLGDNQECIGRVMQGLPMGCTVNPSAGREAELGIGTLGRTSVARRIVVVGGGPAGMETARVAALRGHEVILFESSDRLGGQIRLGERLPGRSDIGRIVPWLVRQIEQAGVEIRLGETATPENIQAEAPDKVVLATGARWMKSGFNGLTFAGVPGWDSAHVLSVEEVVADPSQAGPLVVIFDAKGFVEAPGIAELLSDRGCAVSIVTPFSHLGVAELHATLQWDFLMPRLAERGVTLITDAMLSEIADRTVEIVNLHTRRASRIVGADTVVMISDRAPVDALYLEIGRLGIDAVRVGDCVSPLNIGQAISSGHMAGLVI
jgi:2,4-dienoyl-CoA reductase-like NADH-dependent reductase (Old Yellow Enzyme family)